MAVHSGPANWWTSGYEQGRTHISTKGLVQEGLILNLDAGSSQSYPGSGVNWYDLSGKNNHHTLINSPVFSNNALTFNGTSQGASLSTAMNGATATCTVVLWYKTTDIMELWVRGNGSASYFVSASNNNNYYHGLAGTPTNYVDLSLTTNPYTAGYKNDVYHMWEAKGVNFTAWTKFDWFMYPSWMLAGTVSNILVYDRVLSVDESNRNFQALRDRFGI